MKKKNKNGFFVPQTLRTMFSDIGKDGELGKMISNTVTEWYDAKHRRSDGFEISFVNSIEVSRCPHCGSIDFKRDGLRKDGTQRYRCNSCQRRFNPLTGTVFDSRKIPLTEWVEFLIHLFQYQSTKVSSIDNRNAYSTGRYWIKKVFETLRKYQDSIVMGERFWIDETYLRLMPRDMERGTDGKFPRGLSRNSLCIMTLTDGTNAVLIAEGVARPSRKRIRRLESHIKPGSHMVDDGEKSHAALVEDLGLEREVHKSSEQMGSAIRRTRWTK